MTIPNFFIVGAAKSGTTALWSALRNHPDIFLAGTDITNKEPSFFIDFGEKHNMSLESYLGLFAMQSNERIIGEASAAYLSSSGCAQKIYDFNPDSKILICLRNPVDRAYSLYNWMIQEGYDWHRSFSSALAAEENRKSRLIPNKIERAYHKNYLYYSSGLYYSQVSEYINRFGHNVKVILFENLIASPDKVLSECLTFLGVDKIQLNLPMENTSIKVFSPPLQFIMRHLDLLRTYFLPATNHDFFVKLGQLSAKPEKIDSAVRNVLTANYKEDISKLEKLLDIDLSTWKAHSS